MMAQNLICVFLLTHAVTFMHSLNPRGVHHICSCSSHDGATPCADPRAMGLQRPAALTLLTQSLCDTPHIAFLLLFWGEVLWPRDWFQSLQNGRGMPGGSILKTWRPFCAHFGKLSLMGEGKHLSTDLYPPCLHNTQQTSVLSQPVLTGARKVIYAKMNRAYLKVSSPIQTNVFTWFRLAHSPGLVTSTHLDQWFGPGPANCSGLQQVWGAKR